MNQHLHVLVKTVDPSYPEADIDYEYKLECPGQPHCTGFQECREPHVFNGIDASEGPYDDCEPDAPWEGVDDFEFHGEPHTWRWGWGWTVPFKGCVLAEQCLDEDDLLSGREPGRYYVRDHWHDETDVELELVGPAPLPEDGEGR